VAVVFNYIVLQHQSLTLSTIYSQLESQILHHLALPEFLNVICIFIYRWLCGRLVQLLCLVKVHTTIQHAKPKVVIVVEMKSATKTCPPLILFETHC
jgi:hypothetical protein